MIKSNNDFMTGKVKYYINISFRGFSAVEEERGEEKERGRGKGRGIFNLAVSPIVEKMICLVFLAYIITNNFEKIRNRIYKI